MAERKIKVLDVRVPVEADRKTFLTDIVCKIKPDWPIEKITLRPAVPGVEPLSPLQILQWLARGLPLEAFHGTHRRTEGPLRKQTFSGGCNNLMQYCHLEDDVSKSDAIVIRRFGGVKAFEISSEQEFMSMQLVASVGCFPPIIAVFQNGAVYEYVPGRVLHEKEFDTPPVYRAIAKAVARIHGVDIPTASLIGLHGQPSTYAPIHESIFGFIRQNLLSVPDDLPWVPADDEKNIRYKRFTERRREFEREIDSMEKLTAQMGFERGFVHNDLHILNMIYNDEEKDNPQVFVLDMEYASVDYQSRDLADLIYGRPYRDLLGISDGTVGEMPMESQRDMLESYVRQQNDLLNQHPTDTQLQLQVELAWLELRLMRAVTHLRFLIAGMKYMANTPSWFEKVEGWSKLGDRGYFEAKAEMDELVARFTQIRDQLKSTK